MFVQCNMNGCNSVHCWCMFVYVCGGRGGEGDLLVDLLREEGLNVSFLNYIGIHVEFMSDIQSSC